ncbi:MAG: hypothetical protein KDJ52_21815 [Anaerolineae bacterium]|nr:hypothetical protein [Anaerolineae bacterium]
MPQVEQFHKQIELNNRRLQKLQEQKAAYGVDTRPHVLIEIEDIEAENKNLQTTLASIQEIASTNPYCGLFAFREEDAPFFFGREVFTQRLVKATNRKPFVTVIGPSGSGKSSVVFAGLVPQLRSEGSCLIAAFRPGPRPFVELADALFPLLEPAATEVTRLIESPKLANAFRHHEIDLFRVVNHILHKHGPAKRLILIADQFEELYTLNPEQETRRGFLEVLLKAIKASSSEAGLPFTLVLTLRADFLEQALTYRPFADILQDTSQILGAMTTEELKESIEKPIYRQGARFENRLVGRILEDVGDEPGNLPLLEFALTQLWNRQIEGQLTHAAYEAIGQVAGALTHYADEIFGNLNTYEQAQARRVFIQLVQPGIGTKDTRRLATRIEFDKTDWHLIQKLADFRLVVTNRDGTNKETVEVVHEALIQNWEMLRNWIAEYRKFRIWQEGFRTYMKQWQMSQNEEDLLSGSHLSTAQEWLQRCREHLTAAEITFIEHSGANYLVRKRYVVLFFVLAGGLGAAVGVGLMAALMGSLVWQSNNPTYFQLPLAFVVFIFGLMGGLWGSVQGAATTLGFILAEVWTKKPSFYRRMLGGMLGGGCTGSVLFLLFRSAGTLPAGVSYFTVCAAGFIIFALSSGATTLIIPKIRQLRSSIKHIALRAFIAGSSTGFVCFGAVWLSFQLLDLVAGSPFWEVALFFAPIEGMVGSGMVLGLSFASRLGYMLHTTHMITENNT